VNTEAEPAPSPSRRPLPCSAASWTRPGLGRGAALLSALIALLPLLDLLLESTVSALGLSSAGWPITVEQDAWLFGIAAVLALASGPLGRLPWRKLSSCTLAIDDQGLVLTTARRARRIPLTALHEGLVTSTATAESLVLRLRGGAHLTLALGEEAHADEALAALQLGPDRKRFTAVAGSTGMPLFMGCVGIFLGPFSIMLSWAFVPQAWLSSRVFPPLMCLISIALMLLLGRLSWPERITIGADGLVIHGRFRTRFLPYPRLQSVTDVAAIGGLGFTLAPPASAAGGRGAKSEMIVVDGYRPDLLRGTLRRIEAARAAFAEGGARAMSSALDPAGKRLDTWITSLAALAAEARSSYRRPAISVDSLLDLLSRPDTEPGPRIGAAIALKKSGHEGAVERIRIAAESVASEEVQAALESIAVDEAVRLELVEAALKRARL
jgi:hypothetical protein